MAELINGGHKVVTSNPTEIVSLRARGYSDYVAPKTKPKANKAEPKVIDSVTEFKVAKEAPEELTKN